MFYRFKIEVRKDSGAFDIRAVEQSYGSSRQCSQSSEETTMSATAQLHYVFCRTFKQQQEIVDYFPT